MSRSRSKRTSKRKGPSKGHKSKLAQGHSASPPIDEARSVDPEQPHDAQPLSSSRSHPTPEPTDTPTATPLWRRAPLTFAVASLFLGLQVWLPLSYYLGDYPWDERFAWRMFSTVRSLNCQAQAWEGAQPGAPSVPCPDGRGRCTQLRLSQALHMVWVNLLKRGRREVARQLVEARCERGAGRAFYLSLTCPHPEAPHPLVTIQSPAQDLCAHPEALLPHVNLTPQGAPE